MTALRIVGYGRVSTDEQVKHGTSLPHQREAVTAWAKTNGHRLAGWYQDDGISGANGPEHRPQLGLALYAIRSGDAGGLVFTRYDRLARALTLQEAIFATVWDAGGRIFSCEEEGEVLPDDPIDPMRTALRQMKGVFAQLEKAMIRARMAAGRARKVAAGGYAHGAPPYGWASDGHGSLVPIPAEQAQIDLMRALREAGTSYRGIVALLEQSKVPARRGRWHPEVIRRILVRDARIHQRGRR